MLPFFSFFFREKKLFAGNPAKQATLVLFSLSQTLTLSVLTEVCRVCDVGFGFLCEFVEMY